MELSEHVQSESEVKKQAEQTFHAPRSEAPDAIRIYHSSRQPPRLDMVRKKILVIDDDTAVRESLMNALSYEDFQPIGAVGGDEGLRLLETEKPDLVLLDLNMPGKNGWQVFKEIVLKEPLLPVIVLTARPNQLFTSLGAGVGALIEKPFDFLKLVQAIRELINEPTEQRWARLNGEPGNFHYHRPNGNDVSYAASHCASHGLSN